MNLTKNQIYIISAIVILVVAYFLFFKKKGNAQLASKMATPPPPPAEAPAGSESGYAGIWNGGYEYNSMPALSGGFDPYNMIPAGESGFRANSGDVTAPGNINVPGISNTLDLGSELGAGRWGYGGGKNWIQGM